MKFTEDRSNAAYTIHAYAEGEVTLALPAQERNEENRGRLRLTASFVISAGTLVSDWPPRQLEELEAGHMQQVAELDPEVVLFGAGDRLRFPSPALLEPLIERGIGVEVMDTKAACRTYNILAAEGRRVAAALIISP